MLAYASITAVLVCLALFDRKGLLVVQRASSTIIEHNIRATYIVHHHVMLQPCVLATLLTKVHMHVVLKTQGQHAMHVVCTCFYM